MALTYLTTGDNYRLLAVIDEDNKIVLGIKSALTSNFDLLSRCTDVKFTSFSTELNVDVNDSDDVVSITKIWEFIKNANKLYGLTDLKISGLETPELKSVKEKAIAATAKIQQMFGVSEDQMNKIVIEGLEYERLHTKSEYWSDKLTALTNSTLLANTDDETKALIKSLVNMGSSVTTSDGKTKYTNQILKDEGERVFFYANEDCVMPEYDEVAELNMDTVDLYLMKGLVPQYHKYIGSYVNYIYDDERHEGGYVNNPQAFIKDPTHAAVFNDYLFREVISNNRASYAVVTFANKTAGINVDTVVGDSVYDEDAIRSNEEDYYKTLCDFEDMCLTRDMLSASVGDWIELGLDVKKFIPSYDGITRACSMESLDLTTGRAKELGSAKNTLADLEAVGLTREVFEGLNAGSPTSNKWFSYAISVALTATRAYTGLVQVPFGYDSCEFNRTASRSVPFSKKYMAYLNGSIWKGNRFVNENDIEDKDDDDDDVIRSTAELGSITEGKSYAYWTDVECSDKENRRVEAGYICDTDAMTSGSGIPDFDLASVVSEYATTTGIKHAYPEALIKCLRFGFKKPRSLQLNGTSSRVDLTTGEIITPLDRSKPVYDEDGKTGLIYEIVVADSFNNKFKEYSAINFNQKVPDNRMVVGVGIATSYIQPDKTEEVAVEYVDIMTLSNDASILATLKTFDGSYVLDTVRVVTVAEVLSKVSRNVTKFTIRENEKIITDLKGGMMSKIDPAVKQYKLLQKVVKDYSFFSFVMNLCDGTYECGKASTILRYFRSGKGPEDIMAGTMMTEPEIKFMVSTRTMLSIGGLIYKVQAIDTSNIVSSFNTVMEACRQTIDTSISLQAATTGDVNDVNKAEETAKAFASFIGNPTGCTIRVVMNNANKAQLYLAQVDKTYYVLDGQKTTLDCLKKELKDMKSASVSTEQFNIMMQRVCAGVYAQVQKVILTKAFSGKTIDDLSDAEKAQVRTKAVSSTRENCLRNFFKIMDSDDIAKNIVGNFLERIISNMK